MERIYLDNGATTPLCTEALDAMKAALEKEYGNPSGVYTMGVNAKNILNVSRSFVAKSIGAYEKEIFFTSGGTESDNWALRGAAMAHGFGHIISVKTEHHAVLNTLDFLKAQGFKVTLIAPDRNGRVSAESVISAIREDTFLISMMLVNNETGVINPVKEVGEYAKKHGILMHTDAVAAYAKLPCNVNDLNVDLLSASAHKFNGPKGTGFLYVRRGTPFIPLIYGGGQERGMRSGTENTAGIAGLGAAAEVNIAKSEASLEKTATLKKMLFTLIKEKLPDVYLNGEFEDTVSYVLNIGIPGVMGTSLLILLDVKGICASTGATCNQASKEPSHVLKAMGLSDDEAASSLRFTLSDLNTEEEMRTVADAVYESVTYLRSMRVQG